MNKITKMENNNYQKVAERKFWLDDSDYKKLREKAKAFGFKGKGFLSHFLEKIATTQILFIEGSLKLRISEI